MKSHWYRDHQTAPSCAFWCHFKMKTWFSRATHAPNMNICCLFFLRTNVNADFYLFWTLPVNIILQSKQKQIVFNSSLFGELKLNFNSSREWARDGRSSPDTLPDPDYLNASYQVIQLQDTLSENFLITHRNDLGHIELLHESYFVARKWRWSDPRTAPETVWVDYYMGFNVVCLFMLQTQSFTSCQIAKL